MPKLEVACATIKSPSQVTLVMGEPGRAGSVYIIDIDPIKLFVDTIRGTKFEDTSLLDEMRYFLSEELDKYRD